MLEWPQSPPGDDHRHPGQRLEDERNVEAVGDHNHAREFRRQRFRHLGGGATDIDDDGLAVFDHGRCVGSDGHLFGPVGGGGLFERHLHGAVAGHDRAATDTGQHATFFEIFEVFTNRDLGNAQSIFEIGDAHLSADLDGTTDCVVS
jgi:hypothetical protein